MGWHHIATAFGLGCSLGILAGIGLKVIIDYGELASYRRVTRGVAFHDIDPNIGISAETLRGARPLSSNDMQGTQP